MLVCMSDQAVRGSQERYIDISIRKKGAGWDTIILQILINKIL